MFPKVQATGRNGISPSFCVSRKKSKGEFPLLQSVEGRFFKIWEAGLHTAGMSGVGAAPNSLWGPLPWGKGGKNEKMGCPDGAKVGGGHWGSRGAAEDGNAAEKLGLRRHERSLCSSTGQCWSWGFRYQKLSRPAAGLWDGLLWERCSGVGCRGQESSILLPKHLLPIRALPLQTQGIFLVERIQSLHGKQGSMAGVQKERHKLP